MKELEEEEKYDALNKFFPRPVAKSDDKPINIGIKEANQTNAQWREKQTNIYQKCNQNFKRLIG
jgi:hypothetical protein